MPAFLKREKVTATTAVEIISPPAVKLADLTAEIRIEHEAVIGSLKAGFHHAVRCGELLIEAKRITGHGGWLPWFRANQWISARTASDYMRITAHRAEIETKSAKSADLTIQAALKSLSPPKPQTDRFTAASIRIGATDRQRQARQRCARCDARL